MSDVDDTTVGQRRRIWALRGVALAAATAVSAPVWAQSAEDQNSAELSDVATVTSAQTAMPNPPQPVTPTVPSVLSYPTQGYAYPADIDCNDAYYVSYCLAYATWLDQYYAAYGYGYPYDYWYYGYPVVDVAFGTGLFRGHRFHNFHHFVFAYGIGFHGGFHGGGLQAVGSTAEATAKRPLFGINFPAPCHSVGGRAPQRLSSTAISADRCGTCPQIRETDQSPCCQQTCLENG